MNVILKVLSIADININLIDSSIVEHYIWKNGLNGVEVEHLMIIGGGHTWLGVITQIVMVLQIMILIPQLMIWNFF